ncbi:MAG: aldo/keto reductase [Clostridia bacterium]|nr:aldo/keto reductase [Clostridia bacterium]
MDINSLHSLTDCAVLANGVKIPCIGYGTWQTPDGEIAENCVKNAIEAGYRHIDTAFAYGNEQSVGRGIKRSGVKREDLFITTKHWVTERGYAKTVAAAETSLQNLGLDYLDLYLVHWPCVSKISPDWEEINLDTWRGFEKMVKDGKIRAIGVSNYQPKHLEILLNNAEIKPMVNQLEFHPGYIQLENVLYAQSHGMLVECWSPLGNGAILSDERLKNIAAKYSKSVAQLCIRFALQNGVLPIPKSTNADRMKANAEVFDFEISADDMDTLKNLPVFGFSNFLPEDAPADALANE